VGAGVAEYADGRLSWSRFETLVAAKFVEADPERAAEAERAAAEDTYARVGRDNEHGHKTLHVCSDAAAMTSIDASIDYHARILAALGDTDTLDQRRAKAVQILAKPTRGPTAAADLRHPPAGTDAPTTWPTEADDPHDTGRFGDEPEPFDDDEDCADTADTDGTADKKADPVDAAVGFVKPFRPHEIGPDTRFACGFDPAKLLPSVTVYLHLYARTRHRRHRPRGPLGGRRTHHQPVRARHSRAHRPVRDQTRHRPGRHGPRRRLRGPRPAP
jgi:hypothetical protein